LLFSCKLPVFFTDFIHSRNEAAHSLLSFGYSLESLRIIANVMKKLEIHQKLTSPLYPAMSNFPTTNPLVGYPHHMITQLKFADVLIDIPFLYLNAERIKSKYILEEDNDNNNEYIPLIQCIRPEDFERVKSPIIRGYDLLGRAFIAVCYQYQYISSDQHLPFYGKLLTIDIFQQVYPGNQNIWQNAPSTETGKISLNLPVFLINNLDFSRSEVRPGQHKSYLKLLDSFLQHYMQQDVVIDSDNNLVEEIRLTIGGETFLNSGVIATQQVVVEQPRLLETESIDPDNNLQSTNTDTILSFSNKRAQCLDDACKKNNKKKKG
ncbi:hypothetical protein EBS02_07365, partial [bacterium]|nr:hypothetical protein [bacterium]